MKEVNSVAVVPPTVQSACFVSEEHHKVVYSSVCRRRETWVREGLTSQVVASALEVLVLQECHHGNPQ